VIREASGLIRERENKREKEREGALTANMGNIPAAWTESSRGIFSPLGLIM
jgi:hypothetical protein